MPALSAWHKIVLNTGFKAEAGSHFVAKIGNCLRGCGNGRSPEMSNNELDMIIYDECNESGYIEEEEVVISENKFSENAIFVIYPNPSSGVINIELIGIKPAEITSVSITNSAGMEVYYSNVFKKEIDLSNLQSRLYSMSILVGNKVISSNFTIL